jgi:hypothetical protein
VKIRPIWSHYAGQTFKTVSPPPPRAQCSDEKFTAIGLKEMRWAHRNLKPSWRRGLVVQPPPATEETGAMGREIEYRQDIGW